MCASRSARGYRTVPALRISLARRPVAGKEGSRSIAVAGKSADDDEYQEDPQPSQISAMGFDANFSHSNLQRVGPKRVDNGYGTHSLQTERQPAIVELSSSVLTLSAGQRRRSMRALSEEAF